MVNASVKFSDVMRNSHLYFVSSSAEHYAVTHSMLLINLANAH